MGFRLDSVQLAGRAQTYHPMRCGREVRVPMLTATSDGDTNSLFAQYILNDTCLENEKGISR